MLTWCEKNKEILKNHFLLRPFDSPAPRSRCKTLLRIALVFDIPIAINKASADFMITSSLMDNKYEHEIIDFKNNVIERSEALL
jgi:methylglyoxal synthase